MVDLTSFAKMMAETEKRYSDKLSESTRNIKNPLVRTIMEAVSQDSYKHSLIYNAIAKMLTEEAPLISYLESDTVGREINEHIQTEKKMIETLVDILNEGVENKAIKFLLESILRDELFHHALLKHIYEIVIKREALTESDIWDMIWKDAFSHGTPGG